MQKGVEWEGSKVIFLYVSREALANDDKSINRMLP